MDTRKRYPIGLTDKQWEQIYPLPCHKRTPEARMCEYLNAILVVLRTGPPGKCCRVSSLPSKQ